MTIYTLYDKFITYHETKTTWIKILGKKKFEEMVKNGKLIKEA